MVPANPMQYLIVSVVFGFLSVTLWIFFESETRQMGEQKQNGICSEDSRPDFVNNSTLQT